MADINSYPIATPTKSDKLLGTQVNELGQPITKSFLINGIMELVPSVISGNAAYAVTLASNFGTVDEFGNIISLSEAFANKVIGATTSAGFATAAQLSALSSIVTTQGNGITGNTVSIATATNELTTLATSVSSAASDITNLYSTVTNQGNSITGNTTSIAAANNSIVTNATAIAASASEITDLRSVVTTQGSDIVGNAASIATANSSISTNATAIAASASDITNLTSTVVTQGNTIAGNTTSIANANNSITTNATNISANTASLTSLSAEIVLKPDVFRQDTPPALTNAVGSIWYDTNDNNKVYILVAGLPNVWTESTDGRILTNISALAAANTAITANTNALGAEASKITELQSQFAFTGPNITGVSGALSTSITTAASNATGAVASDLAKLEAVFSFNANGDVDGTVGSLSTAITTSANTAIANASLASAQSVTDLSSAVNGNTANISTVASTLATVEGYTESRYSINLDAGGAVAGMSILAQDGSTQNPYSEIRFNADKFKIFNNGTAGDATDYDAPFEVSGGVVKIKSANIGTINFGDIANTPPTSYTTIVYAATIAGDSPTFTKGTNNFYAIYQGATQIDLGNPSAISALAFSQVTGDTGPAGADGPQGVAGAAGANGSAGVNARAVNLTCADQVFTYNTSGTSPSPSNTIITATALNTSGTVYYQFFKNDTSVQNGTSATYTYVPQVNFTGMPDKIEVQIREGGTTGTILARDQITISGIKPGTNGTNGTDGMTVLLSNEAHTLPTTSAGVVDFTGSGTTIRVFEGVNELVYDGFGFNNSTWTLTRAGSSITPGSITDSGNYATIGDHSGMTANTASITYTISGKRASGTPFIFDKTQSFAKSIQGVKGADGADGGVGGVGPDGARSFSGHLYYTAASASAPVFNGSSVVFNFANNTFTNIPTGFSASAPEATPGSGSNNYWHVPVTVVEGSPNTITFGSVTRMFGFSGLVTFSGTTINNAFDYTAIDGGAITTGSIKSANYIDLASSSYSSTGTKINLADGSIESKNFYIDSSGNAEFSGTLAAGTIMTNGSISGGSISGTQFFGATGTFSGDITAAVGNIGGWSITGEKILTNTMALNSARSALEIYTGTEIVVDINASTSLSSIVPASPVSSLATDTVTDSDSVSGSSVVSAAPVVAATATSLNPAGTLTSVNSQFSSGDILTFAHSGQSLTAAEIADLALSVRNSGLGTSIMAAGTFYVYTKVYLKSSIGGPTIATLQDINLMENVDVQNSGGGPTSQTFYPTLDTAPKSTTFVYGGQANLYLYVETSVSFTASVYSDTGLSTYTATLNVYTPAYTCTITKEISKTEISAGGLQVVRDQVNYVKMSRGSAAAGAMVKVGGDITATGNITASASDRRLKDNITTIINPLDKINKLNGVYFNWNSIANDIAGFDTSNLNVGLIAQEVEAVLPEATTISPLDGGDGILYKTIWYEKLVPLLLEGIKELSAKVDSLEKQLIK